VVGGITTSTTVFKGKFLLTHLKKSHAFKILVFLMVFFYKNSYDLFCRYTHPKRKDKKTTPENMEELGDVLADDLCRNIESSFKSWLTKLESLRSRLLALGRGRVGSTPFTTLGVSENYYANAHVDKDDTGMSFIIWFVKGKD
jgi:hypothetical protein